MNTPPQQEQTVEDRFRETFRDMIVVINKLAPHCKSLGDLMGMLNLAVENDGQLALLVSQIAPVGFRK